ncbi:PqqD family protein [Paenibacillus sp. sgz500958]|uniref:PqqD family protein n=1 Tax=Paenibacillus sp. sgz500958 TaxID=3242475 RepID=UPI0036D37B1E
MKQKILKIGTPFILRTENDGDGVIAVNGSILKVNQTTVEIIERLESGQSVEEISILISSDYNVNAEEVQKDILSFLHQLNSFIDITKPDLLNILHG